MWEALGRVSKMLGDLARWGSSYVEEEVTITEANTEMTKHLFKDPVFVAKFKASKEASLIVRLKMEDNSDSSFNFDDTPAAVVTKRAPKRRPRTKKEA